MRGMAVTGLNTMHLLVAPDAPVNAMHDLKGLRVSLGAPGSSTAHITLRMLQDLGISTGIRAERIPNTDIMTRLTSGDLDAAFSGFTIPSATVIAALQKGVRLIPIDGPKRCGRGIRI
jgi:TRAP-type uncharacterized transport system substrate-binding protein